MYRSNLVSAIVGEVSKDVESIIHGQVPKEGTAKRRHIRKLYRYLEMTDGPKTPKVVETAPEVDEPEVDYHKCKLISIDAWRDDCGGWSWNDMSMVEDGIMIADDSDILSNSRKCLAWFRQQGWLTDASKGKVRVDFNHDIMDGVLVTIENKNTGEPILALSSIH